MKDILTKWFHGYTTIAAIVAGGTALWTTGIIELSVSIIGYAWFAVAGIGSVVAIGMAAKPEDVIEPDAAEARIEEFEDSTVTGTPLHAYIIALAMWAAVSFGWVLGGMSAAGRPVVGYGLLVIAAYGFSVGVGIALTYSNDIRIAVDPTKTLETDG